MADREECTGTAASWCPNCGTCNCPEDPRGGRTRDRATCPLHGPESRHAETLCAGGCGEIVSAPGDRCDPCEVKHLRAELDALRAIIEGRTTPPTVEETQAHIDAGGSFRVVSANGGAYSAGSALAVDLAVEDFPGCRWWALDANGAPCAWPVVTEAPRG